MYEEDGLHRFGTALPELDEETIPSKKPIRPEDQIVTDENGKRRFHGAFTGGFSAGYWNTVGSQEGWTPATFKSSRGEKAAQRSQQRPDDFMDDEDRGEFGFAPQRLQTRTEYTSYEPEDSYKRKLAVPHNGPIPGKPMLEQLLAQRDIKIGERILKNMGWRLGQGIGPRQTRKEKKVARNRNRREMYVMQQYGYQPTVPRVESPGHSDDADGEVESSDDDGPDEITFAPDDYDPYVCKAKRDRFGLGYSGGLNREPVLSSAPGAATSNKHINLFEPTLEAISKNNKKISFKGQAFGVGALEEEDEDIYEKDDLSRYDFSLDNHKPKRKKVVYEQDQLIVEGFLACQTSVRLNKPKNPDVPANFTARNWTERRSRFQPMDAKKAVELELYFKEVELSKKKLNPNERAEILGEIGLIEDIPSTSTYARQEQTQQKNLQSFEEGRNSNLTRVEGGGVRLPEKAKIMLERLEQTDRFISSRTDKEFNNATMHKRSDALTEVMKQVYDQSKKFDSTSSLFKPFLHDEQKQRRYEEFLLAEIKTEEEIANFLNEIQPIHLSGWDREMEKKEFIQAKKIFRPLDGLMSQRFVSETNLQSEQTVTEQPLLSSQTPKKIIVERSQSVWKPHSLLCKRYNIAEPFGGQLEEEKPPPSAKISVFDYLEDCLHKKSDFQTPVIIPMKIPEIKPILKQPRCVAENVSVTTCNASTMTTHSLSSSDSSATSIVVVDQLKRKHSSIRLQKDDPPKVGRPTAKTDLEKLSEESISKPPSEKLELYKAIFDDSSDEDGTEQYEVTVISKEGANTDDCALKKELLGARLSSSFSADYVNVLRNTSPPRGIFSALLSTQGQKQMIAKAETNSTETVDVHCDIEIEVGSEIDRHVKSSPDASVSKLCFIPASAKPVNEHKIEFKQPTGGSSKTSLNTSSTTSSKEYASKKENHLKILNSSNEPSSPNVAQCSKEEKSLRPNNRKRKLSEPMENRLGGSGGHYGPTAVSFDVPSTSSSLETPFYGPQLPQHIRTSTTSTVVDEMNKVVEEKMIRFLVQRAKRPKHARNDEWVEKKVRKILKSKTLTTSSSSSTANDSSDEDSDGKERKCVVQKKKSKKSKSRKKSKKKSRDKKSKNAKKKKDKH